MGLRDGTPIIVSAVRWLSTTVASSADSSVFAWLVQWRMRSSSQPGNQGSSRAGSVSWKRRSRAPAWWCMAALGSPEHGWPGSVVMTMVMVALSAAISLGAEGPRAAVQCR